MHADPAIRPDATNLDVELFKLPPHDWVPNNRRLPIVLYRQALQGDTLIDADERAAAFEALFDAHQWPPRWRDSIFDYHHFHSTAHEVLAVVSGEADVIIGGPGGRVVHVRSGDVMLLPAGTGHCLQSGSGRFSVVGAYPAGQQWDIRRDALTRDECAAMDALPFPASDPVLGDRGPLIDFWMHV
ncbi:cupin domain-containing protein [Paraburkholderia rhizosphaerae]|uniref:Uncharacterized protein YjlB n=1 Tax=Paraburkholderia rhizosphaerae TaxID=480658 RepID=A0A4R8L843_9BURK|nr:cupin domain-containing protein [Paraburkholderia rhizosphaerae]TDY38917.1 uncharacterized protein YjlB [Paraburkholderia rhizosphaerae]